MSYEMNTILRERPAAHIANRADPFKVFDQARAIFNASRQTLGTGHDHAWDQFRARTYGLGPDAMLLLAQEALEFALAREKDMKAVIEAATQAQAERVAASGMAKGALMGRQAFANASLPPLWALGAQLAGIAAEIAATRPVAPSVENSFAPSAEVGTEEERAAFVAKLAERLASITATLKAMK